VSVVLGRVPPCLDTALSGRKLCAGGNGWHQKLAESKDSNISVSGNLVAGFPGKLYRLLPEICLRESGKFVALLVRVWFDRRNEREKELLALILAKPEKSRS